MFHSKSCRCEFCSPLPSCKSQECSPNWKNRFCKLRKQWSEHSKCGSRKHLEDCTDCRSPSNAAIGKFGVAWVADIPFCDSQEPKGWQIEIIDTPQGILKKCKQLISWLNNPPSNVYDSIEGNDMPCNLCLHTYPLNTCEECYEDNSIKKKGCNNDYQEPDICSRACGSNSCEDNKCCVPNVKCKSCIDHGVFEVCGENCCSSSCTKSPEDKDLKKSHFTNCKSTDESSCDECNSRPRSTKKNKCQWSISPQPNECNKVFRKDNCCCHCKNRFYKNACTTYDIDIVPQRDLHEVTSDINELDSKILCAGIRTSQICRKIKEEKRQQLLEKQERELNNAVLTGKNSEDKMMSIYMSAESGLHGSLKSNSSGSQRRSNKFRKKEI
ncbi:hypothetical protein WA026_006336 [Henosepilachna vigintioctopunctata]|uniref:Uncharacterized protein n=1 Tax=Henosepilachna vigintioctopunctata TaxID=420089 RepID=A0AAW1TPH0_9CUCU